MLRPPSGEGEGELGEEFSQNGSFLSSTSLRTSLVLALAGGFSPKGRAELALCVTKKKRNESLHVLLHQPRFLHGRRSLVGTFTVRYSLLHGITRLERQSFDRN